MSGVGWGSVAEWVSGIGALAAAGVALYIANRSEKVSERSSREARQALSRDRTARLLVDLVKVVEDDVRNMPYPRSLDQFPRSPEGQALCRALWGRRNWFGTVWHVYCEDDQASTENLAREGKLIPKMRAELQEALDQLDHEDRAI